MRYMEIEFLGRSYRPRFLLVIYIKITPRALFTDYTFRQYLANSFNSDSGTYEVVNHQTCQLPDELLPLATIKAKMAKKYHENGGH